MQIVIANSVGVHSDGSVMIHSPSRWTASSSDIKTFTYYPWELAYTSSLLKKKTNYAIKFVDGCLEKLTWEAYFEKIKQYSPDYLVMESSTRTIAEDKKLALRLKFECGTKLIFCGQHATAFPEEILKFADFACIGEYEYTVLEIVQGKKAADILGLYPNPRRPLLDFKALPWPEDTDVSRFDYAVPGEPSCEFVEIQAYGSRGCPWQCTFCVCSNLYYAKPNWRPREVLDVVAELAYLKEKYPKMEGIFFDEEAHNVNKKFILDLSEQICEHGLNDLHINAMCGYSTIDEQMLLAMKKAGYYMLRVGVETASEKVAKQIGLGSKFNIPKLKEVLVMAKDIGMKMYGTFTFGAPGSNIAEDTKTLNLMDELVSNDLLWRYQVSICTPQPGTPYFKYLEENNYLLTHDWERFDGGNTVVAQYPDYSGDDILNIYKKSQKYYDVGFRRRFERNIAKSIDCLSNDQPDKILVFRSSRVWQVKYGIELLKQKFPEAKIYLLGQEEVKDEFINEAGVDEYISFGKGYFNLDTFPKEIVQKLAEIGFAKGIIFYNNSRGNGYDDVKKIAGKMNLKELAAFNLDGELINL